MPIHSVNGVNIFYEISGSGALPVVMVHGSWSSHHGWDQVAPRFSESFRVMRYDRRGHSQSDRPPGQDSVLEDVADLAALIEHFELGPAWIVSNSFGTSITLRLVGDRPDLFRGLIGHEPPVLSVLGGDPQFESLLEDEERKFRLVAERIAAGDHEGGAEQFVETVALGPGSWSNLPPEMRETLTHNAPTFLNEVRDPDALVFDPEWVSDFDKPALFTRGTESPPMFTSVVEKVAAAFPDVELATFQGAGHIPHVTHPDVYAEKVSHFIIKHEA
ncbi:MAG TPA: alpha/beta hydrolase [Rhodothermales bacterium]|nr:alpha/beta hydrolase [Rhodothermales bacterium]